MAKILKRASLNLRVKTGYSTAFVLLLISYLLTFYGNRQFKKQVDFVKHANEVLGNLDRLVSGVKDGETGVRGYINTKDSSFLSPYKNSFAIIDTALAELKAGTKEDTVQQKNLASISFLIGERYDKFSFVIDRFPKVNYVTDDTLIRSFYSGRVTMDSIRYVVSVMQSHEQSLLELRSSDLDVRYIALNIIIITSLILALIFAVFSFYTYRKEYRARMEADKKAEEYEKELQGRIAELDKANRELILMKQSEKFASTGRVARTIAHEVRNPLTNIDLAVSQIKAEFPVQDEDSSMLFDMVIRNSKRINHLISELLNATRFTEMNCMTVSVNAILDAALDLAKDRIDLNRIQVEKRYDNGLSHVSMDAEKTTIAFLNIIVNALEAMEPGKGVLQITTRKEEDKCVVEITDNGHGMTEEELNKLFEPYFTTKASGNGLGLINTANIILNHKGLIDVYSTVGKGTRFVIKFDLSGSTN